MIRLLLTAILATAAQSSAQTLGREQAVATHLTGTNQSVPTLLAQGRLLFTANWTDQEGGIRPLTKGTGRPLSDPSEPLSGNRSFNRISGPDANSCAGCHNEPYGIPGGGGDFVTSVFVLGQRFDFATFDPKDKVPTKGTLDEQGKPAELDTMANLRATTGMFGAGYLEMLARQITRDLQHIRDHMKPGETKELISKGVSYGQITKGRNGLWDVSKVQGLPRLSLLSAGSQDPPSLVIRPWHQAANVVSIREFSNNAFNQHHGIQTVERFGADTDPDGDGVMNEMTKMDVTAVALWQASLQVPGRVIPNDPAIERAVLNGERVFRDIGCATCHIPALPLDSNGNDKGWIFTEPGPYNPPGNLRTGEMPEVKLDLNDAQLLPAPRLKADKHGVTWVPAYTDFKLHDICEPGGAEPLDMNFGPWAKGFTEGNRRFLTKRLWGFYNEPPYFHNGMYTTARRSILAHAGEAEAQRRAFQNASKYDQDSLIEFLKTLQVLPPGTKELIVDENFKAKVWPPVWAKGGQ